MKRKNHFSFILLLFIILFLNMTQKGYAQAKTHDGLFLRFQNGHGFGSTTEHDLLGYDRTSTGLSGIHILQIGFSAFNNFIIYGEVGFFWVMNPNVKWKGASYELQDEGVEERYIDFNFESVGITIAGLGICYYLMPSNIYMSLSINIAKTNIDVDDYSGNNSSSPGLGLTASIGKERWVSKNWGLGLAILYHSSEMVIDSELTGTYNVTNHYFGVVFSATYN